MPAAGSKGSPKNPGELKDDTGLSREEKRVNFVNKYAYMKLNFLRTVVPYSQ